MTRSADVMTHGEVAVSPDGPAGIVDVGRTPVRTPESCEPER